MYTLLLHLFFRSTITIFRHRVKEQSDFRVWNYQVIRYAGYKMTDGTVIGDPDSVEFTEVRVTYTVFVYGYVSV